MTLPSGTFSLGSCAIASCRFGSNFCPSASIGCSAVLGQEIGELFQDHAHAGKNRRCSRLRRARRTRPSSKLSTIGNEPLEQRAVGVLDRVLFLARGAFFVILEIGLAAQREIAKAIEIGLQTFAIGSSSAASSVGDVVRRCRPSRLVCLGVLFQLLGFFHVLRIAIKVMSSFCGCAPTKFRTSSIRRVIIAGAPFVALARTRLRSCVPDRIRLRSHRALRSRHRCKEPGNRRVRAGRRSRQLSYRTRSPLSMPRAIPGGFTGVDCLRRCAGKAAAHRARRARASRRCAT